ncbi:Rna exonuclease [Thalictrum thalictroides]|uniref:Rna exonuclease n=1 Tax=Thalictrum thalictroides TaxID=46969 RepID=A0A7J6XAU5_THATH|nr:Rna exonuclease [Thalictrum thalictroides]
MGDNCASAGGARMKNPLCWNTLFSKGSVDKNCNLEWINTEMEDDVSVVPREIIDHGVEYWKNYLVGYFVGKRMPYFLVKRTIEKEWKLKGGLEITTDGKIYYFKFTEEEDKNDVLERGHALFPSLENYREGMEIERGILVIRPWTEEVFDEKSQLNSVPIWVKVYDVPKQLWSPKGFSFIGSRLGKPMCCDNITLKRERLDFARLCIEIPISSKFPTSLKFKLGEDKIATIMVEYDWKPQICSHCVVFGHTIASCPNKIKTTWVPKNNGNGAAPVNDKNKEANDKCDEMQLALVVPQAGIDVLPINEGVWERRDSSGRSPCKAPIVEDKAETSSNKFQALAIEEQDSIESVTQQRIEGDEIVHCSLLTDHHEVGEAVIQQYQAEKETFEAFNCDGQAVLVSEPQKEVEIFKDHIFKPAKSSDSKLKPKLVGGRQKNIAQNSQSSSSVNIGRGSTRASGKNSSHKVS